MKLTVEIDLDQLNNDDWAPGEHNPETVAATLRTMAAVVANAPTISPGQDFPLIIQGKEIGFAGIHQ